MKLQIQIIGYLFILLSIVHIIFPKYFRWKEDLKQISLINRELMYIHTFFIAVTVFLMGLLCITASEDMIVTELGKKISFGFGVFWFLRLLIQFFGYSSELWKGKTFETAVHILFSIFWMYTTALFFAVSLLDY